MPAKGKRVAVRQAQLNRRRRRQARAAAEGGTLTAVQEDAPATAGVVPSTVTVAANATTRSNTETGPGDAQPAAASARPAATSASQGRNTQPLAYSHLAGELRRILILVGVVTAVLLGVSFVV